MKSHLFSEMVQSLEDNTDTDQPNYESEISLVAYMKDPDGLKEANKVVNMQQYSIRVNREDKTKGNIRVRRSNEIHPNPELKYWSTIKMTLEKTYVTVSSETNIEINNLFFDSFIKIAENGTLKTRYTYSLTDQEIEVILKDGAEKVIVPNLEFEVDVFQFEDKISPWVKIDIELDHVFSFLYYKKFLSDIQDIKVNVDVLPLDLRHVFNSNLASEEDKKIEDVLYDKAIFGFNF